MTQHLTPEQKQAIRDKYKQIEQEEESNKERNAYEDLLKKMNEKDQELIKNSDEFGKPVTIDLGTIKAEEIDSFLQNIDQKI